jgi:MFS family permease
LGSSAALFCGGLFNVAELPFVIGDLGGSDAGFSLLLALFGFGFVAGSLVGASGGALPHLRRRYLQGLLIMGVGWLAAGAAPTYAIALVAFPIEGFGNGLLLVYERLLIQRSVPDRLAARVFGVRDALTAWAFALAFVSAGALIALVGTRELILGAGAIGILVWAGSALAWRASPAERPITTGVGRERRTIAQPARLAGHAGPQATGQIGSSGDAAQLADSGERWLVLLDDLGDRPCNPGIELRPGVGG